MQSSMGVRWRQGTGSWGEVFRCTFWVQSFPGCLSVLGGREVALTAQEREREEQGQ